MTFLSHPNQDEIIKGSGYLFYNPTNIASEATWGTKLGYTEKHNAAFSPGIRTIEITEEDSGSYVTKSIFVGATPRLYANLINWNATVLGLLFPSLVGGTSGKLVGVPGSLKTGTDTFTANKVLFVPEDTARHPAVYFKDIAPKIIESAQIIFSHSDRTVFPFACIAKSYQCGPLSEIIL